jgi:hypothetical protein
MATSLWAAESSGIPPSHPQLPAKISRCLGTWSGRLELFSHSAPGKGTDVIVTVKEINTDGTSAKIVYTWARSSWGPENGSEELVANISYENEGTSLNFTQNGRNCVLRFKDDGEILLWRHNQQFKLLATMKKTSLVPKK